jgi:PAS domain S-box-containing protein
MKNNETIRQLRQELEAMRQRLARMEELEARHQKNNHALRESEEKYRGILENMDDAYYEVDLKGNYAFFNEAMISKTGYSREELTGMNYRQVLTPETHQQVKQIFSNVYKTGQPVRIFEYDLIRKDGAKRNFEAWVSPIFDKDNRITGFKGMANDVTNRKQAEDDLKESRERLKRSEERYRVILDNMEEAYYEVDLNGNHTFYNETTLRNLGYTREEMLGMNYRQYVDEENAQKIYEAYHRVFITGETIKGMDWVLRTKAGTKMPVEGSVSLMRDSQGNPIGFRGVVRDITKRKEAEKELRESEEKYRLLAEKAMMGIFWINDSFQFIYVNDHLCKILGRSRSEVVGKNFREVLSDNSLDLVSERYIRRQRGEEVPDRYEIEVVRPDGEVRRIEMMVAIMLDKSGRMNSIGQAIDITERKQAEEERERLQQQLTQAQKMESIGRLAGGVAHDFNNMLGVIMGHAEIAMMKADPLQPFYKDLQEISKAAGRSANLTRQLLAFARKQTVTPKVLVLNEVVEGMLKMLQRLIGEDIELLWLPDSPRSMVKVDPGQIDQILANLCVNARDAIAGVGKIIIETGNAVFDEDFCSSHIGFSPGDYVMIAVRDNGCGMDKETLDNLFEPFFTTKNVGQGTGLGLATVYGIVKQNGGFIHVDSDPGHGATFSIYLPRHAGKTEPLRKDDQGTSATRGNETVLLVEDEPAMLEMTTLILEQLGYNVLKACTPGEAIHIAENHPGNIHLLMTDVVMPEMNGRDLARKILSLYPDIKRLFMSGYTADVIVHQGVLDEGVHFISKPFSVKGLADKVRETLG